MLLSKAHTTALHMITLDQRLVIIVLHVLSAICITYSVNEHDRTKIYHVTS